jgi:hypothetical protein
MFFMSVVKELDRRGKDTEIARYALIGSFQGFICRWSFVSLKL